ncbi:hypothetical protein ESCOCK437M_18370 [Escherichia coli]
MRQVSDIPAHYANGYPSCSNHCRAYIWLWHERDTAYFIVFTNIPSFSFLPSDSPIATDRCCPELRIPLTEKSLFQALAVDESFSASRRIVSSVSQKPAYCIFFPAIILTLPVNHQGYTTNKMQPFFGPVLTSITLNVYRSLAR